METLAKWKIPILIIATLVAITITLLYVFDLTSVTGNAMAPKITYGKICIVVKSFDYKREDIIVFKRGEYKQISRIIGVSGDEIFAENGQIIINGNEQSTFPNNETPFVLEGERITVKKDTFFVVGDNYRASLDSRNISVGLVDKDVIIGKILSCY